MTLRRAAAEGRGPGRHADRRRPNPKLVLTARPRSRVGSRACRRSPRPGGRGSASRRPGPLPSPASPPSWRCRSPPSSCSSLTAPDNAWPHLMRTVLPGALRDTAAAAWSASGALCLVFGTGTAWLVTMYRFPGRAVLDRLLVLPLAMPTYIIAYCYVELLDFSGPVQRRAARAVRLAHGARLLVPRGAHAAGRRFSCCRPCSTLTSTCRRARASCSSRCACSRWRARWAAPSAQTFWAVALPLARPALAAGAALALMECLNDLGAVQYLGVQTLTVERLYDLAAALEPRRGGADRAGRAAVRAGADRCRAAGARAAAASITPPAAIARSRSPTWRAGAASRRGLLLPAGRWPASWRRSRSCWCRRSAHRVGRAGGRLLAGGAQQRQHAPRWRRR